jgi:hypothetical protein
MSFHEKMGIEQSVVVIKRWVAGATENGSLNESDDTVYHAE